MLTQLGQLAFGGILNSLYSVLLLGTLAVVAHQWWKLRDNQRHWDEQWDALKESCKQQLDRLVEEMNKEHFTKRLREEWLTDLASQIDAQMPLPSAEVSSQRMLSSALEEHPYLHHQEEPARRWERLPGVAVLLGLLGTFIGLTGALTQLPYSGGLKQLAGGLQQVLPLMGTAFWTSVCGLIASLVLRYMYTLAARDQRTRNKEYTHLHRQLTQRCQRELYPHIAQLGLQSSSSALSHTTQQALAELPKALSDAQSGITEQLSAALTPFQERFVAQINRLTTLPEQLAQSVQGLNTTVTALQQWRTEMEQLSKLVTEFSQTANAAIAPIAHTERVLEERIAGLTHQHEALTQAVEVIEEHERKLPEKLKEVLKHTLRPAHRSLQLSAQGLNQSIEMLCQRDIQERDTWQRMFLDLGERFGSIDRLAQVNEQSAQKLADTTRHLADIANRLRFHPNSLNSNSSETQATSQLSLSDELEHEIDQLLESSDNIGTLRPKKD